MRLKNTTSPDVKRSPDNFFCLFCFSKIKDTEQNSGETKGTPVNTAEKQ